MTISGKNYKNRRDNSLRRWETMGYKGHIEEAMNYASEIESSNFVTLKKRYESEFLAAKRTGLGGLNTYYYSAPIPGAILKNKTDWQTFDFSKSSYVKAKKNVKHSWAAGASAIGFGGLMTKGSHRKIDNTYNFDDFRMSFKMTKCNVSRPWLGTTFIKSRYWKYSDDGKDVTNNQMVSDGNGKGMLPAITTELYLLSDLDIGFVKVSNSYEKVEALVKAGTVVHFGPFAVGGTYSYDMSSLKQTDEKSTQGEKSTGILLLGRKFNVLDLAPDPLPTINDSDWVK